MLKYGWLFYGNSKEETSWFGGCQVSSLYIVMHKAREKYVTLIQEQGMAA
ncbi:hypothetical protein [Pseudoalteromonas umbrosa]|nr:hypothetical protein [Pseudoalteromonas sp. B95]MDK1287949.1 hypothetical protein [Pseudoalteromonas sp. B95]